MAVGARTNVGVVLMQQPQIAALRHMFWAFMRQNPMVSILLLSRDAPVDLVKDEFDLVIWLDAVACSIADLAARPWFDPPRQVCAEK